MPNSTAPDRRPNIVFISAEQQRGDTLRCCGADWMTTPNLDRFSRRSVVFTQAFSCAATCVSSRAAFYTGLYPHSTGMYDFSKKCGDLHWTHRLAQSGYRCVSIGKTHLPHGGFHESIAEQYNKYQPKVGGEYCEWYRAVVDAGFEPPLDLHRSDPDFYDNLAAITWPLPEKLHPDIWVADRALEWLERDRYPQPFYLHIGFLGPHDLYDPPQRFLDPYDDDSIPMPQVSEEEVRGIPDELYAQRRENRTKFSITTIKADRATPERVRRLRKHYYAGITAIDEKFGEIIDCLEQRGLLENTIVIYTSDHGDHLFDHDLYYKGELYDTVVRVPLMVYAPGAHDPGRHVSDLVSQLDLSQYILDKAGVDGSDLEGIPLTPCVERGISHARQYAYAEEGKTGLRPEPDLLAMIRSRTHKLIYFPGGHTGQLFDLEHDPGETRNLWGTEDARDVQASLTAQLLDWLCMSLYKGRKRRFSLNVKSSNVPV